MLYKDYVHSIRGCPFCGQSQEIFVENEHAYLTYAKAPYHEDHLLVIPKRHVVRILELEPYEQTAIDTLIREALRGLDILGEGHYSVLARDGKADGENKSIDHLHFHIVPEVRLGDLDHQGREREILTDDGMRRVVERFSKVFKR
jgi:diadenosine tetraphosphate (Ap4A) HIT family hydrolase